MSLLFRRNFTFVFLLMVLPIDVIGVSFSRHRYSRRGDRDDSRDTRIAYACENSTMHLNCTTYNGVIRVIRANYGRFVLSTCNPWSVTSGWNLQCSAKDSFNIVAARCDGRPECSVMASNRVFPDPCTTTHKYLEVYYYCQKSEPTVPSPTTKKPATTTTTTTTTKEPTTKSTEVSTTGCDCDVRGTKTCMPTKECICRENFTGTKCDQCTAGYYNFPACIACDCDNRATLPGICSKETGKCLCGQRLTLSCDACLPGFVNYPYCQVDIVTTKAPSTPTPKPTESSPMPIKKTTPGRTKSTTTEKSSRYTCKSTESEGVWWPVSVSGIVVRDCPRDLKGKMTWECGIRGWKRKPNLSNCVSPWLDNFEDLIEAGSDNVEEVATTLNERTANNKFGPGDLKKTTLDLFPKLNEQLITQTRGMTKQQKRNKVKKFAKSILKTGSNLLTDSNSWKGLPKRERTRVATSLVVNMEETGYQIADSLEVGDPPVITRDLNIFMEVNAISTEDQTTKRLSFPSSVDDREDADDFVTIPVESLVNSSNNGEVRIVFLVYKSLSEFMSPPEEEDTGAENNKEEGDETANNDTQPFIGTNIFSTSVNGRKTKFALSKPLTFTLKHKQAPQPGFHAVCSYWQFNESLSGQWSDDGCSLVKTNNSHTTCQCDHMTNFAILMDTVGTKLSLEHQITLTAITYLGCIVSITCLLCCIFTFCFFKNLQCDRNTIHKNLCLSLMMAEIVFLVGINLTQYKIVCGIVAGLLHFWFLAAFSWMCLEGVQLYVMLIEVFEAERSRRLWYYLFGYGVPTIIVGVSAAVNHEGYGTELHCWLKTENYFIWSFVGPVCAVILINIIMLGIAIYMMCRHSNTLASSLRTKEKTRLQKINGEPNSGSSSGSTNINDKSHLSPELPSWLKGAIVLVVLLGLTWSFGVLYISKESVVMAYLFTILNTLQGVFIFVFHCVMNEKVKKEYKKFAYRATWLPGCIRSLFVGYSGSLGSTSPNSTSSGGHLLKFWSGKRRRKSSGSTLEKSSKGKKRRSDIKSSEVESFSHSISNHGNIDSQYRPPSNNYDNGYTHGYMYANTGVSDGGIVGDLSVADCSVIDSEYVSEFCHNKMQVSMEKRRYSSGSEEEGNEENNDNKNRLSVLSEDSAVKNSDFVSTEAEMSYSEMSDDDSEKSKDLKKEEEPLFPNTNSEKNLLNNLVTIDGGQTKSPSSNELRIIDPSDSLSRSTPNMKLIQGYEAILNNKSDLLIDTGETQNGRKPVTRLNSDCPGKFDPHRYVLDHSEC